MTTELTLTINEYFAKDGQSKRLEPLIAETIRRCGGVLVEQGSEVIRVRVVEALAAGNMPFAIQGHFQVPFGKLLTDNQVKAKLLLPLFVDVKSIQLPHQAIFYTGLRRRSIADFFARNLLMAAVRNAPFELQSESMGADEPARLFMHEYFAILKHSISEEQLKNRSIRESIDLIRLNACLNAQYFSSAILNWDAGWFGSRDQGTSTSHEMIAMKSSILDVREELLARRFQV